MAWLTFCAGLFHHASKHYERVLANTERRMQYDPNVSPRFRCLTNIPTSF